MRGSGHGSRSLVSYVDLGSRVPADHPLRVIRRIADAALGGMSAEFDACYARIGRPSIAPERLMRALLLQAFYSIRSQRQLMERLEFDLLFRWFVGLGISASGSTTGSGTPRPVSKNRDRLLEADAATEFLSGVVRRPQVRRRMGREPFSVDGRLIDAWASMKSFKPRQPGRGDDDDDDRGGRDAGRDWRGERRSNATHASTTDPDARLCKKAPGQASRLCFVATALMENRNGLVVGGRTTRHPGYAQSRRARKRIEEVFGWLKTVAGWRKTRFRGLDRTEWGITLALAAYDLTRMPKLLTEPRP